MYSASISVKNKKLKADVAFGSMQSESCKSSELKRWIIVKIHCKVRVPKGRKN